MLTIRTVQNIKRGSRITYLNGVYAIVLGVLYLALFKLIVKMNFRQIDAIWQVFAKYNPEISGLFVRLFLLKGIFIIAIGILITYLSLYILRKKDKNAWFVLFILGVLFWPSLLTIEIFDKNIFTIVAASVGWVMFIIGMLLPIKYYIEKEYTDY
ncbi:hypothetical protein FJZ17_01140 [Candidatus Pacearchaeota archaeon]|nr:hypothetical protein [Candidatus Pacearchaeota archaeon]